MTELNPRTLLPLLLGVYTVQSLIGAMTFQGLPGVLRAAGHSTDQIGLIFLFMLPWVLKFLWAPAVDRYRHGDTSANRRFLLVGIGAQVTLLAILALTSPTDTLALALVALGTLALVASTVDNGVDGFAVESLREGHRGWGNAMQIGGGFLGAVLGGGAFLILIDYASWSVAVLTMALVAALALVVPARLQPASRVRDASPTTAGIAWRRALFVGVGVVMVYQLGLRLTQAMTLPFFIDHGLSLGELGQVNVFGSSVVSLVAVLLTGWVLTRYRPVAVMLVTIVLQLPIFAALVGLSQWAEAPLHVAIALMLIQAGIFAASFVALYTAMMAWCRVELPGLDFAVLQSADTAVAMLAGVASGLIVAQLGYDTLFLISLVWAAGVALGLPALTRTLAGGTVVDAHAGA